MYTQVRLFCRAEVPPLTRPRSAAERGRPGHGDYGSALTVVRVTRLPVAAGSARHEGVQAVWSLERSPDPYTSYGDLLP